jgi:hypothetical protein
LRNSFANPLFVDDTNFDKVIGLASWKIARGSDPMTDAAALTRQMPRNSPLTWVVTLIALALLAIGIRAVLMPAAAATGFGVPLSGGEGLVYVQAFGARNIGLSLLALTMIGLDQRRALGVLFVCSALIAMLDGLIVARHLGLSPGLVRPGAIALLLLVVGGFLLRGNTSPV